MKLTSLVGIWKVCFKGTVTLSEWVLMGCLVGIMVLGTSGCIRKAHTTVMSEKDLEQRELGEGTPEAPRAAEIGGELESTRFPEEPVAALEGPTAVEPFPIVKDVAPEPSIPSRPPESPESPESMEPIPEPAPPLKGEAEIAKIPTPAPVPERPLVPGRKRGVLEKEKGQEEPSLPEPVESPFAETPPSTPITPPQEFLEEALPVSLSDVFFDYDRSTIRADAIPVLEGNARLLLVKYPDRHIVIEGHCDERGTVEYNLALGAKRAQAVKEYLIDLGVPASSIDIISYGKEKPFCREHSLRCWQLNRRGHFVLK